MSRGKPQKLSLRKPSLFNKQSCCTDFKINTTSSKIARNQLNYTLDFRLLEAEHMLFFCLLPVKRNAPNECSVWSVIRDDESVSVGITFFSGRRWPAWRQRQSADPSYLETWSWHPHPPNWMQLTWSYAKKQKTTLERGHDAAVNFSHFRYECIKIKIKSKLCQKSLCNLSELTSPSTPLLQKGNTVCQFSPS